MAEILDFRNDRLNVSGGYRDRCEDGGACTSCCSSRQRGCLSVTEWNQPDTAGWISPGTSRDVPLAPAETVPGCLGGGGGTGRGWGPTAAGHVV